MSWRDCRRRSCSIVLMLALVALAAREGAGQTRATTENEVKAAYLLSFLRFVEWPTRTGPLESETFTICILGVDPFGAVLDETLSGATTRGKRVESRRITAVNDARGCHLLFVGASEAKQLTDLVVALDRAAVLTVSDLPQFVRRGGMIQFVNTGNRVRFEVNLAAAQYAGVVLGADLLQVASVVRGGSTAR